MIKTKTYLPAISALALYLLIFWVRWQQGGWDLQLDLLQGFRSGLDQQIALYLPSPQAELLSGILLGENKNLPVGLHLGLRDTSTLHIVVASGQNLSMVAAFFFLMVGFIKRKWAVVLSFAAICFYTFLTGFQVPILRAAIMVSLGFLGILLGRERGTVWILIVTVGAMLLINPGWITSISFQLSVLATAGVVVVAPILLERLKFLPNLVNQDLAVSFSAQIMVFPVIAQNFHQLSLVALPANLLVLWTVAPVMVLGGFLLLFSFIMPPLAWVLSFGLKALLIYFIYIINFFAGLPFAWVYIGEFSWLFWLGYYLLITAGLLSLITRKTDGR